MMFSKSILKTFFLGFIIITEVLGCEEIIDEENCIINAFCSNSIQLSQQQYSSYTRSCQLRPHHLTELYGHSYYYPVDVYLRDINQNDKNQIYCNPDSSFLIESLNLNSNNIYTIPTISQLQNLQLLYASDCNLNAAKLSNQYKLQSLTNIDLSHNNINLIYYEQAEHIYANLQILNISFNELDSIPHDTFYPFTKLTNLDLSNNFITSFSMLTFEGIKELMYLNISNNQVSDINGSLFRFTKLIELNLSNNTLTSVEKKYFNELINLEKLDLHLNVITNIENNTFVNMVSLKYIDLSENKLEFIDKDLFSETAKLQYVDLSKNYLKHFEANMFKNKALIYFNIEQNNLQGSLIRGMFEGMPLVTDLDLSHQTLTSVADFAFIGSEKLSSLLLNNNNISYLGNKSFSGLNSLEMLDLSSNNINNFDFDKQSLHNLVTLHLKNNKITKISESSFKDLNRLQYIYLSENNIATIEALSFVDLRDLIELEISNNPLQGELTGKTFEGLTSLPTLDISKTQFTIIKNCSFFGMSHLTYLNLSHGHIEDVKFNAFLQTTSVESLDLSYNKLTYFFLNVTDLQNLKVLVLSFNFLETIHDDTFYGLTSLAKLFLNNNKINIIAENSFLDLRNLYLLDLSFNKNDCVNTKTITKESLTSLYLSNMTSVSIFDRNNNLSIKDLHFTDSDLKQVKLLSLKSLHQLETVVLTKDKISNVSVEDFAGITHLKYLDLSSNVIDHIQPGSFKDNKDLSFLNISQNCLTKIGYGVFPGLFLLQTIDISFNTINTLQSEVFYDLKSLKTLIVDHNRISSLYPGDFEMNNVYLEVLSLGENPIPCELIYTWHRSDYNFEITSIGKDRYKYENSNGVTCNFDKHIPVTPKPYNTSFISDKILLDIRDILLNMTLRKYENNNDQVQLLINTIDKRFSEMRNDFRNITAQVQDSNSLRANVKNISDFVSNISDDTNVYLPRIIKLLASSNSNKIAPPIIVTKENTTIETVISYVGKIKDELENKYAVEKDNLEDKLKSLERKLDSYVTSSVSSKEKLISPEKIDEKSSVFTETCVGLILIIVLCLALVKLYKARVLTYKRRTMSTRRIADSMENSQL